MSTIKFSIELNTFQKDDKDLPTNACEKSEHIFKRDDASVSPPPGKVLHSHYTPGPNKQCKYRRNLLQKEENNYTAHLPFLSTSWVWEPFTLDIVTKKSKNITNQQNPVNSRHART